MIVKDGQVYGLLTVIGVIPGKINKCSGERYVYCQCECGNKSVHKSGNLRNGHTKSCGCYRKSFMMTHGNCIEHKHSPEYSSWSHVISRCYSSKNKHFHNYGGRGISVCDRWRNSFENFLADMGPRPDKNHSIDRIDNNGNYEPGNCRWASRKQQNFNKRTTKIIEYNGVSHTIDEWSDITGVNKECLRSRIKRGWPVDRILSNQEDEVSN